MKQINYESWRQVEGFKGPDATESVRSRRFSSLRLLRLRRLRQKRLEAARLKQASEFPQDHQNAA
ncbi:MAG: hypothetical protein COV44_03375 [Deltaproteobacteria bacterium CG11_big_fil_rev_8_21_14_0_20_45_16]|nr:MAG: hypothetical protein COV44_03375 [Deltaproteobacteria bacterium CG11_big_fil_rev_8_21_14_0_20_45_16]